jgi:hypothetical protein
VIAAYFENYVLKYICKHLQICGSSLLLKYTVHVLRMRAGRTTSCSGYIVPALAIPDKNK